VIPGDIGTQLAAIVRAAAAVGELPPQAARMTAAGTWRPAPAQSGGAPGTYATSLPFALAGLTDRPPGAIAAALASQLSGAPGIAAADTTGGGYLTVTVTDAVLTGLAPRIVAAGPGCARSDALAGIFLPAPPQRDLAAAPGWRQAWRWQADDVSTRLAQAAGATIKTLAKRDFPPTAAPPPGPAPVAIEIEYAGADAVRYALTRTAADRADKMGRQIPVSHGSENPFAAVSLAHADAASVLRWAADLRIERGEPGAPAPGLLGHPRERQLLDVLSWLPERVAGAARRRRPQELTAYTEHVAASWLDCRESCPALPFGGRAAPTDAAVLAARLWLADAARTVLAAGLALIGVAAPERL